MYREFDRSLFATVLLAMAVLLSLTSVARFPAALRPASPGGAGHAVAPFGAADRLESSLR
jgi:hypothetical protein